MVADVDERPAAAPSVDSTADGADANAGAGINNDKDKNRKRRMSKRERKNLKKKKVAGTGGDADAAPSAAAASTVAAAADKPAVTKGAQDAVATTKKSKPEPTLEEYMANYIPAPSANKPDKDENNDDSSKSLGKWFPKASVIKSSVWYSNDYLAKLAKEKKKQKNKNTSNSNAAKEIIVVEPKASLVLFYQYVNPVWSEKKVSSFLSYLTTIAEKHRTNIGGRIRVSSEGVNCTVSAASTQNKDKEQQHDPAFEAAQTLRHFAQDLRQFDPEAFSDTDFKYVDDLSADRHFNKLKLLPVKELVFYGLGEGDCAVSSAGKSKTDGNGANKNTAGKDEKEVKGGIHLDAKDYHEMLKRNDAVVIDVRNHYEAAIGRFDGQIEGSKDLAEAPPGGKNSTTAEESENGNGSRNVEEEGGEVDKRDGDGGVGGAEYIDPKMRKSTDFTSWLAEPKTKEKLEGKTVMMFCTGGIRCERASAYLNSQMGSEVKGVYQLQGGIERYLQAFPEGGFWRGKNFVFDKREAIGAGNINGDGGVVSNNSKEASKSKKGKEDGKEKALPWGTECAKCHKPWDRYIGKRKCYTCGVPVLVCDTCMSSQSSGNKKKKKNKNKKGDDDQKSVDAKDDAKEDGKVDEDNNRIRCPLCIEEGVTVPAEDVEFTNNGIGGRLKPPTSESTLGANPAKDELKKKKKGKEKDSKGKAAKSVLKWGGGHATKKKEKRKWERRPCQFGIECVRKDCFFYHPEREKKKVCHTK